MAAQAIPIKKVKANPDKLQTIATKFAAFLAESVDAKYLAQKAFITYMRSVFLQADKTVYYLSSLFPCLFRFFNSGCVSLVLEVVGLFFVFCCVLVVDGVAVFLSARESGVVCCCQSSRFVAFCLIRGRKSEGRNNQNQSHLAL
jgi:hypothetical protein